ncbi:aspartyl/glutamyl-tRNA(Asn/Gln) amidotransferase subunit C [Candidatus Parcubacteria bacterium 4484_255]|nr:MAG: aspartyl/glutamyl-tRNA(Asn/Gln) amidotransferase subunit C [Candidatus Parcubacteria bacterium 4484_255]
MIDEKQIQHIADLAKIKLSASDIKRYQKQLERILGYVNRLQKVKVQGIEPYHDLISSKNIFRDDKALIPAPEISSGILMEAPEKQGRFIKTKSPLLQ